MSYSPKINYFLSLIYFLIKIHPYNYSDYIVIIFRINPLSVFISFTVYLFLFLYDFLLSLLLKEKFSVLILVYDFLFCYIAYIKL